MTPGVKVEEIREVPRHFADLDAKIAAALLKLVDVRTNKYSDPLRATIAACVIQREDQGFNDGQRASGIELLWTVCEQYSVRGEKDQLFSITDLQRVELRDSGFEGLRKFYAHWTLTLSRMPAKVHENFQDTILELFVKQLKRSKVCDSLLTFYGVKKNEDEEAHGYEWLRNQVYTMLHDHAMTRNREAHEKGAGRPCCERVTPGPLLMSLPISSHRMILEHGIHLVPQPLIPMRFLVLVLLDCVKGQKRVSDF